MKLIYEWLRFASVVGPWVIIAGLVEKRINAKPLDWLDPVTALITACALTLAAMWGLGLVIKTIAQPAAEGE